MDLSAERIAPPPPDTRRPGKSPSLHSTRSDCDRRCKRRANACGFGQGGEDAAANRGRHVDNTFETVGKHHGDPVMRQCGDTNGTFHKAKISSDRAWSGEGRAAKPRWLVKGKKCEPESAAADVDSGGAAEGNVCRRQKVRKRKGPRDERRLRRSSG